MKESHLQQDAAATRWQKVKAILVDALEHESGEARIAFIEQACAGDEALRAEVEELLAQRTDDFEACSDEVRGGFVAHDAHPTGLRAGSYELVRELGRGGMGSVWLAHRADGQFQQQVAIKLLKRGTDTDEVLRRFRAERQILARLSHPNIARLYDAGTTEDGLPYFVMEYVEGVRVTDFARERKLSIRDRIELFLKVCAAVNFAHQNLVVHRDLKPGNILVTADGEPKLLDFGIAKLLSPAPDTVQLTIAGEQRLTAGYASPEQVRNEQITTATDIYSLGALLYEILTGETPHQFPTATPAPNELMRVIVQEETRRASGVAPAATRHELRGDLDNILAIALRKEPEKRYSGVPAFADDLRRYLDGRPVRARPATLGYRASKFIRRNRLAVAAAAVLLLSLVGGIVATAWEARIAQRERARAEKRFNDVRRLANSFMFELEGEIDKGPVKAKQLLVSRALEYLNSLAQESQHDPALQAELATAYVKIGDLQGLFLQQNLGDTKGALESYGKAFSIYRHLAAIEPQSSNIREGLAVSVSRIGDISMALGKPADAVASFREAIALLEQGTSADRASSSVRSELAMYHRGLANALGLPGVTNLGDTKGAIEHLRKAASLYESISPEELARRSTGGLARPPDDLGAIYGDLAVVLRAEGDGAGALDFQRKALAVGERALAANPHSNNIRRNAAALMWNLANMLLDPAHIDEAAALTRRSFDIYSQIAAEDANDVNARKDLAQSERNMGRVLSVKGDVAGALEFNSKALELFQQLVAQDQANAFMRRQLAFTHLRQSMFLADSGKLSEAEEQASRAIAIGDELIAADPKNATARNTLAQSLSQLGKSRALGGKWSEARDAYQQSLVAWTALRDNGALAPSDAGEIDKVNAAIAKCDAALPR